MTHASFQLLHFLRKYWQATLSVWFSGTLAVLLTSVVLTEPQRALVKLAFTLVLLRLAIGDILVKRVPATVTLPWMGVGLARAIGHQDPSFLPFWLTIFFVWVLNLFGGGDAKLLMGLFGLWPDLDLLQVVIVASVVFGMPLLVAKYWHTSVRELARRFTLRIFSLQLLPTPQELDQGIPFAYAYCFAGALYLWAFR